MDDYESSKVAKLRRSEKYAVVVGRQAREYECNCGCGRHETTMHFVGGTLVEGCKAKGWWVRTYRAAEAVK